MDKHINEQLKIMQNCVDVWDSYLCQLYMHNSHSHTWDIVERIVHNNYDW